MKLNKTFVNKQEKCLENEQFTICFNITESNSLTCLPECFLNCKNQYKEKIEQKYCLINVCKCDITRENIKSSNITEVTQEQQPQNSLLEEKENFLSNKNTFNKEKLFNFNSKLLQEENTPILIEENNINSNNLQYEIDKQNNEFYSNLLIYSLMAIFLLILYFSCVGYLKEKNSGILQFEARLKKFETEKNLSQRSRKSNSSNNSVKKYYHNKVLSSMDSDLNERLIEKD